MAAYPIESVNLAPTYGSYSAVSQANALTLVQLLNQALGAGVGGCSYIGAPSVAALANQVEWENKIIQLATQITTHRSERKAAIIQAYSDGVGPGQLNNNALTAYRSDWETAAGTATTTASAPWRA
jgi:hypothetical protein